MTPYIMSFGMSLWGDMSDIAIVEAFIDPNFSGTTAQASQEFNSWLSGNCK